MPKSDLTEFVEQVTGDSHLRVEDDLGDGFVRLRSAEAERRQAKHDIRGTEGIVIEMLRNARDAHARNIFVATSKEGTTRTITMIDDGDGIPQHMFEKVFEARVTSKLDTMHLDMWGVHGRGMALYAIKVNAKTAAVAASKVQGGTSIVVTTDTLSLPEKTDQSTEPVFALNAAGTVIVRGPKNINRTIAEFAYIDRETCTVYAGSPTEIAATLYDFGCSTLAQSTRAFCDNADELPVCKRLALAGTPLEFSEIAESLGLQMSERSARRVMDGTIAGVSAVGDSIHVLGKEDDAASEKDGSKPAQKKPNGLKEALEHPDGTKDARGLKITDDDRASFAESVASAYRELANAYYLDSSVEPEVKVRRDRIDVTIPIRKTR